MAAAKRPARPSILPKRSCGSEAKFESGELMSISWAAPLVRGGTCRSGGDSFDNLRRQPEADVFRHYFEFLHVVEAFGGQKLHGFLHQTFWRGSASSQRDRLHVNQPCELNVFVTINEM